MDKWLELKKKLEEILKTSLSNTGNTVSSCFQYKEKPK